MIFNQRQRRQAAIAATRKIKNNPVAMGKASTLLNSDEFQTRMNESLKTPGKNSSSFPLFSFFNFMTSILNLSIFLFLSCPYPAGGDVAKKLLREVDGFMSGMGKFVTFSREERKSIISKMYAMKDKFGSPSCFLTFSPDDTNDSIMLRFCYPIGKQDTFPSSCMVDFEDGRQSFKDILDNMTESTQEFTIPLSQVQKNAFAAMNPVAVAQLFLTLQRVFFRDLLGLTTTDEGEERFKKTRPRVDVSFNNDPFMPKLVRERLEQQYGKDNLKIKSYPLGQGLGAIAVTEEQHRATLHMHSVAWTTLKPELMQLLLGEGFLESYLLKIIDNHFATEISALQHMRVAMSNEVGGAEKSRMSRQV